MLPSNLSNRSGNPGFDNEAYLKEQAGAIERKKIRADFGITYDADALKTIDDFKDWGLRKWQVNLTCDPEFSTKSLFLRE